MTSLKMKVLLLFEKFKMHKGEKTDGSIVIYRKSYL
jgi:hypothetical protein